MNNASIKSNVTPTGRVKLTIFDAKTNEELRTIEHSNLVVASGRRNVSRLIGGDGSAQAVTDIAVGTDGTLPVLDDTTITDSVLKSVESVQYPDSDVQFAFVLEGAEANGIVIREFGLLLADGTLFARVTPAPIIKNNTIRVEGTWTIKF